MEELNGMNYNFRIEPFTRRSASELPSTFACLLLLRLSERGRGETNASKVGGFTVDFSADH